MKTVIVYIILFAIVTGLIIGVVIPIINGLKTTGIKSNESIQKFNNSITVE